MIRALIGIAALAAGPALAHQAPSGWEYPPGCCNGKECHPSPIEMRKDGYWLPEVQVLVPYGDHRIKPSGDADTHICNNGSAVYCIYIPVGV